MVREEASNSLTMLPLVIEFLPKDGLAARAVTACEVAALIIMTVRNPEGNCDQHEPRVLFHLAHESGDDAMKGTTLQVERLPTVSNPLLSRAK